MKALFAWLKPAPPPPSAPIVARPAYPCGIRDCFEEQTIISQDERWTVVECPTHLCVTSWDTTKSTAAPLRIIRPRDRWTQHGINKR